MVIPFLYLGLAVGGCHKRSTYWDLVIVRMKKRLNRWKGSFLYLAGRICLIKSVLSTIPLFCLSLFKMSVVVTNELVKIQRDFLWGGDRMEGRSFGPLGKRCVQLTRTGVLGLLT